MRWQEDEECHTAEQRVLLTPTEGYSQLNGAPAFPDSPPVQVRDDGVFLFFPPPFLDSFLLRCGKQG